MKRKPFPIGAACEAAETARFVNTFLAQMMPRAEHRAKYIGHVGIDALLQIQRDSFSDLAVMWLGLGPGYRERFENELAPASASPSGGCTDLRHKRRTADDHCADGQGDPEGGCDAIALPSVSAWVTANVALMAQSPFDRSLWIKDLTGTAGLNNITVTPYGTDTVDGLMSYEIINANKLLRLYPLTSLDGWYVG